MRKNYSKEDKQKIINLCSDGVSVTEISKEYGLARSTIYSWIKEYNKKSRRKKPINMHEVILLRQQCEQQNLMIEILKSASCSIDAPQKERYEAIKELSGKYSTALLCKAMNIPKGSYYNYILRNKNENTEAAKRRSEVTHIIEKIFNDSKQIFGAWKIHAILQGMGYHISPNTVAAIMHENGWFSIRGGAKKHYLQLQEKKRNILNQQFTVSKPNEVWVGDVTQFLYNDRKYYICVILDLFARKVVGYRISPSNSTQLTKGTFRAAYESRKPTNLLFHSDQGCNYTSKAYVCYLKQLGVTQSFSRAYTPYDNSVIESFFKSLKTERLYRTDFRSEREFKKAVKDYIYDYNTSRPHSKLRYKTPDEYETAYFEKLEKYIKVNQSNNVGSDL